MITRRKFCRRRQPAAPYWQPRALRPLQLRSRQREARLCQPADRPLAAFGEADKFVIDSFLATMKKMGLNYEVVVKDSQSNPNRAAEVAKELIVDDEIT